MVMKRVEQSVQSDFIPAKYGIICKNAFSQKFSFPLKKKIRNRGNTATLNSSTYALMAVCPHEENGKNGGHGGGGGDKDKCKC